MPPASSPILSPLSGAVNSEKIFSNPLHKIRICR
nr:MAG TPA: hypothetical protein [Caudoviricetes sp.]